MNGNGNGNRILCSVKHLEFDEALMRRCPHPTVVKKYGTNNEKPWVSIYVCKKCVCSGKSDLHGGITCTWKDDKKHGK